MGKKKRKKKRTAIKLLIEFLIALKLDYSSQIGERAKALTSCKDYNPSDRI